MALPKFEVSTYDIKLPISQLDVKYRPYLVKEEKNLMIANETGKQKDVINAVKNPTVIGVNILKSTIRCKCNSQRLLKKYSQLFCLFFHVRLLPRPACCLLQVL